MNPWELLQSTLGNLLAFSYDIVANYGLSIILLTILVNIVVFPLTLKQTRSTRAMQELQPEVEKLRKKHKDEPDVMNQAVMELYRERKVSPMGCFLPLLVQMPIWFALFRVLREPLSYIPIDTSLGQALSRGPLTFLTMDLSIEPSRAVSDFGLFSLDTLPYIMVVLIVVGTGFMQQKLSTPRNQPAPQNQQAATAQRITKILPLFFGIISYIWPAGLNLYFATSNTFRTGQQLLIFRIDGRPGDDKTENTKESAADAEASEPQKPSKPQGSVKKRNRRRRG